MSGYYTTERCYNFFKPILCLLDDNLLAAGSNQRKNELRTTECSIKIKLKIYVITIFNK